MRNFEYVRPVGLDEVFHHLDRFGEDARLLAGGTTLVVLMKNRLISPRALVDLGRVPGLNRIDADHGLVRIGALATHRDVERSAVVGEALGPLAETARAVANLRVRNAGTLGGNLCNGEPASDPGPTLLALGAQVRLRAATGDRVLPVGEFWTGYYETQLRPGEVLVAIEIPRLSGRTGGAYLKFTPRSRADKPLLGVCAVVRLDGGGRLAEVRLAAGNVAPAPLRFPAVEQALVGSELTDAAIESAVRSMAAGLEPVSDGRGSSAYRRRVLPVIAARALKAAVARGARRLLSGSGP